MQVSIVMPVLNEAIFLRRTLRVLSILDPEPLEIIVVDAGSTDGSSTIAAEAGAQVITAQKARRAAQMHEGALAAHGEILWFIHADTWPPDDSIELIRSVLANKNITLGGFRSIIEGPRKTWHGINAHHVIKTWYAPLIFRPWLFFRGARLFFGDQAMFCRRADYVACGGFDPNLPIMEEADLCIKLARLGRGILVDRVLRTSDRRIARYGGARATMLHLFIGAGWGLGADPLWLKKFYDDQR